MFKTVPFFAAMYQLLKSGAYHEEVFRPNLILNCISFMSRAQDHFGSDSDVATIAAMTIHKLVSNDYDRPAPEIVQADLVPQLFNRLEEFERHEKEDVIPFEELALYAPGEHKKDGENVETKSLPRDLVYLCEALIAIHNRIRVHDNIATNEKYLDDLLRMMRSKQDMSRDTAFKCALALLDAEIEDMSTGAKKFAIVYTKTMHL